MDFKGTYKQLETLFKDYLEMKFELMKVRVDRDRMVNTKDHSKTLDEIVLNDDHINMVINQRVGHVMNKYGELDQKKL